MGRLSVYYTGDTLSGRRQIVGSNFTGESKKAGVESFQVARDARGLWVQASLCSYTGEWEVVRVLHWRDKERKRQVIRKRLSHFILRFTLRRLLIPNLVLLILRLPLSSSTL
jgi:hypothetical protein